MLLILLVFHIYWWKLICAMIIRQLKSRGKVGEDIRSGRHPFFFTVLNLSLSCSVQASISFFFLFSSSHAHWVVSISCSSHLAAKHFELQRIWFRCIFLLKIPFLNLCYPNFGWVSILLPLKKILYICISATNTYQSLHRFRRRWLVYLWEKCANLCRSLLIYGRFSSANDWFTQVAIAPILRICCDLYFAGEKRCRSFQCLSVKMIGATYMSILLLASMQANRRFTLIQNTQIPFPDGLILALLPVLVLNIDCWSRLLWLHAIVNDVQCEVIKLGSVVSFLWQ